MPNIKIEVGRIESIKPVDGHTVMIEVDPNELVLDEFQNLIIDRAEGMIGDLLHPILDKYGLDLIARSIGEWTEHNLCREIRKAAAGSNASEI